MVVLGALSCGIAFAPSAFAQPQAVPAKPPAKDTKPGGKDDKKDAPAPQPTPEPAAPVVERREPSAADIARAKPIFDAGGRAYDAGDYVTAIQAFEQAYSIAQRDGIVFSIAQAHRQQFVLTGEQEHLSKAITNYRQFLASGKAGPRTAEATKALRDLEAIAATRAQSGAMPVAPIAPVTQKTMLAIDSPTPGAMISIDGSEPAPPQVNAEVASGPHVVKLTAPGFVDKEVTVRAVAGEFTPETFELDEKPARLQVEVSPGAEISIDGRFQGKAPLAKALDVAPGRRFVSVTLTGHQSKGEVVDLERGEDRKLAMKLPSTGQRDAAFVFLIASGVTLVGTGVLAGIAIVDDNKANDILKQYNAGSITAAQRQTYEDARGDRDSYRAAAVSAGAVTGVLGLVGVGLFVFDRATPVQSPPDMGPGAPKPEKPKAGPHLEMRVTPAFGPGFGGIGASGRF
jgi:hypothetical protein